jgi:transaldolase
MDLLKKLKIKVFADGANKPEMIKMNNNSFIQGLTTNPTLMNKAGIVDYAKFCKEICKEVKNKPLSFEVFSDDFIEMERQALEIASWGENVYVKIPITNTLGHSSKDLIQTLASRNVKLNVTAIMTLKQVEDVIPVLNVDVPSYISIFAGRIADTGVDPMPIMVSALEMMKGRPLSELIWASPRELLNIFQADSIGCHVITVTGEILNKLSKVGYDLETYSLDTVRMFRDDAIAAGYNL